MKLDEHMVEFKEEIYKTEMKFTDLKEKSRNNRSGGAIQHRTIIRLIHVCPTLHYTTLPYLTLPYPTLHQTCVNSFILSANEQKHQYQHHSIMLALTV